MEDMQFWEDLSSLVQTGVVTAVNGRSARVKLPEWEEPSGWLTVVQSPPTVTVQGASAVAAPWTPRVNDRVLVLFRPMRNGDGFILGGV